MSDAIRSSAPVRVLPRNTAAKAPMAAAANAKPAAAPMKAAAVATAAPAKGFSFGSLLSGFREGVQWLILGPSVKEFKTMETLRQPDINFPSGAELKAAKDHLAACKGDEDAAVAKLGARAAGYRQLTALLEKTPVSRDALAKMAIDGRLTAKDLAGKGDALTYLTLMATQQLPAGMDRAALIAGVVQEMDDPVKLAQQAKGTCAATTATVVLDRKSPTEYARLVQELASTTGMTRTVTGAKLYRNADWANSNDGNRTPSMRMLEPALMQLGGLGNPVLKYDNDRDVYTLEKASMGASLARMWQGVKDGFKKLGHLVTLPGGLESAGENRILHALTGDDYTMIYAVTRLNRGSAWSRIEQALKQGKSVACGLRWEDGGHEVLLDKIENGYAYFNNPWGESDRMSVDEFRANLNGANFRKT